ncbi:hypothetical protein [Paraburkholderia sp. Ac-20347]|uniref:hypothetical protein n=1 Tax=Paraburkholderia sp. Ac-20347 TaxID=2703892 RepID=UPI001981ED35|nr:hypothetical protein [Paraburkholderia sp. Ac-20347]MBN3809405.1 hypothetical protein [Paraburkholderia sp. Ac-20347]
MSPSTSGGTSYYVPTGLGTADQTWQGLLDSLQNSYYANANSQNQIALGSEQAGINAANQYAPGYQTAANSAAGTYAGLASYLNNQAQQNTGTQNSLLAAGQNVYNLALDPQNALYNRTAQQLQDQTGATNSMYGLGSSAAGAGVANQAMSNFNIDWQNNLLSRATQGLSAYTGAATTAGNYGQLASSQAEAAPGYALLSGSLPYSTAQSTAATPGNLASTYGSYLNSNLYGPAESIQSQIIPYMNYGTGAQSLPYQNSTTNAQSLGSTVSSALGGLGTAYQNAGSLSNLFSGTTGSYGSGDFSGAFTSSPYYSGGGNSYGFTM